MAYTTINKSSLHFTPKLYTGNNGASLTISGLNFQPDLTWIKARNATETHGLYDAVRGALYRLQSNSINASSSQAETVTGWTSDGFSLGTSDEVNGTYNYASWNWKANGQGSSNTDGSINTTYTSANTTSGFSISTYTGTGSAATVGHGLGVVPSVMIVKRTNSTGDWVMYHKSLGNGKNIRMNDTGAEDTSSAVWNATTPTSSVFSVGTFAETNGSSDTFVAYCFAEKQGYSKFGTFTASNPCFVYTGFKPAFVMLKRYSATGNWSILDNKRANSFNPQDPLYANATDAEQTSDDYDLVSNGFVIRNASGGGGGDSGSMLYMAFAEAPLVGTNNVPANAR